MKRLILCLLVLMLAAGCNQRAGRGSAKVRASMPGNLTVWFIDVGQGDSTLIRTPHGSFVLIDAGTPEAADKIISFMRQEDVDRLAIAVGTHPHADHIGGMREVLRSFQVDAYMDPAFPYATSTYRNLLREIKDQGLKFITARRGMEEEVDGVRFQVLWPEEPFLEGTESDANNASIVLRLTYKNISMLFMGDAQLEAIARILKGTADIESDLIKISHHGSADGTTSELLERVKPKYAVIFCAEGNEYGYPHRETMDALRASRCRILRTDLNGTITVSTDGRELGISVEKGEIGEPK